MADFVVAASAGDRIKLSGGGSDQSRLGVGLFTIAASKLCRVLTAFLQT
jgi:hypothetical protein